MKVAWVLFVANVAWAFVDAAAYLHSGQWHNLLAMWANTFTALILWDFALRKR